MDVLYQKMMKVITLFQKSWDICPRKFLCNLFNNAMC